MAKVIQVHKICLPPPKAKYVGELLWTSDTNKKCFTCKQQLKSGLEFRVRK